MAVLAMRRLFLELLLRMEAAVVLAVQLGEARAEVVVVVAASQQPTTTQ